MNLTMKEELGDAVDPGESIEGDFSGVEDGRGEVIDYEGEEGTKPTPAELDDVVDQAAYEAQLVEAVNQGTGTGGQLRIAKAMRKSRRAQSSWRDVLRNFLLDRTSVPS